MSRLVCPRVGGAVIDTVTRDGYTIQSGSVAREPGTPNLIAAASYLYALQYFNSIGGYEWWESYEQELIEYAIIKFKQQNKLTLVNNQVDNRLGVFSFYPNDSSSILQLGERLGQQGICIRTGGHCAHPLVEEIGHGQLGRLSLYVYNTREDIDRFFESVLHLCQTSL